MRSRRLTVPRDQPARVYEAVDNVPDELDAILRRCLEKEPAKRWPSAAELRAALAEVATEVSFTSSSPRIRAGAARRPEKGAGGKSKVLAAAAATGALLLAVGAFALWRLCAGSTGGAGAVALLPANLAARETLPSVVVLPLTSFSGEPEYYVDGITDALISSLARIEGLRVISRQSAMHFKGSQKLLPEIARELGISEAMFHRWKARYGTISSQEAKRLKELESENARLKKLLAEKELDIDMLKEVSRGNF